MYPVDFPWNTKRVLLEIMFHFYDAWRIGIIQKEHVRLLTKDFTTFVDIG